MAQAGKFRERVTFQSLTNSSGTTDKYGNALDSWGNDLERWADVVVRTGRERVTGGAVAGVNVATVRVRSDSATSQIGNDWRVLMRGKYWNITSDPAQTTRQGAVLEIVAETGTAA
jgi:SPP1 family predicted phage head-tail adaptor